MFESSREGCPAKPVRCKELAKALDLIFANRRHPHLQVSKQSSALG
jgi:hypothetical protein